ncbi:MAG: hypothetical protein ABFE13_12150 [Phycisphaerales bacterium]
MQESTVSAAFVGGGGSGQEADAEWGMKGTATVDECVSAIGQTIDELGKEVSALRDRLDPILRLEKPLAMAGGEKAQSDDASPLKTRLQQQVDALCEMRGSVTRLRMRLDI